MSKLKTFVVPGILKQRGIKKPRQIFIYLEAYDREDALWQAYHGVIEMEVNRHWPNSVVKYDLRRLALDDTKHP